MGTNHALNCSSGRLSLKMSKHLFHSSICFPLVDMNSLQHCACFTNTKFALFFFQKKCKKICILEIVGKALIFQCVGATPLILCFNLFGQILHSLFLMIYQNKNILILPVALLYVCLFNLLNLFLVINIEIKKIGIFLFRIIVNNRHHVASKYLYVYIAFRVSFDVF